MQTGTHSRRTMLKATAGAAALGLAGARPSTRRAAAQDKKLVVWDNWTRDVDSKMIEELNAEFTKQTGIALDRSSKSFDDLKSTAKLALSSEDGPDIVQINQGLSDMGAMVKAGILTDLSPLAKQYGWDKVLPPSMAARNSFSPDGKLFGEGDLFGMPITAEFVGVYYNKQKLTDLGLEFPATFDDMEKSLAAAKEKGEVPIQFGNLDGYPVIHTYGSIQHLYVTKEYLDDFIYGRNNVSFDIPENVKAGEKSQEWVKAGYFTPDFQGIGYDDSWQAFKGGKGLYMITGSWISGELATAPDPGFGFKLMPPLSADKKNLHVSGTGMAYAIRKSSPQQDAAAQYINFLVSPAAADKLATTGIIPLAVDPAKAKPGSLYADIVAGWEAILTNDTAGHYLDWATPTFYDTIVAGLTDLFGLNITPEQFVQQMQDDYGKFLAGQQG